MITADKLKPEQRRALAAAARKVRPDAKFRSEFAQFMQQRRELRQNHSPSSLLGGGESEPGQRYDELQDTVAGLAPFSNHKKAETCR
jgi:hypothetical protein